MRLPSLCAVGALSVTAAFADSIITTQEPPRFEYGRALLQSSIFIAIQHGFRLVTEESTRHELKGPFFRDWAHSVRAVSGWGDRDRFFVNYVGHPMMGAVTSYIAIQNDGRGRNAVFGRSGEYWRSRMRALAFSAAYSTQFELGPLSEASLGNVGKTPGTMGVVDLVITPVAGFGVVAFEDALDRYIIEKLEKRSRNVVWRIVVRSVLNPDRAMANLIRGKPPWHRDHRDGISVP